jgi:hypothetical protein
MTNKIDEKTTVTISLVIIIIGGISWLSNINSKVNASEKQLDEISSTGPGSLRDDIKKHGESLARIEGALGIKK